MTRSATMKIRTLEQLTIEDEESFERVELYEDLKTVLTRAGTRFRVLSGSHEGRWDRALFANLSFWSASDDGSDILVEDSLPADVVAHVAWHHLAARALFAGERPGAEALFFGESIASAFDLYLVGRLLGRVKNSTFLETQVPAMAESAYAAGLEDDEFQTLLTEVAHDPERAFEDLRQLLFDATTSLLSCTRAEDALDRLSHLDGHRFAPLLHHYELANWLLYARAYAGHALGPDATVRALDEQLRAATDPVEFLRKAWVVPALT